MTYDWLTGGAMKIIVSGASGLIGGALCQHLGEKGHEVLRLVRREPGSDDEIEWHPDQGRVDAGRLEGLDGVCHLAGENIAAGRWTAARKRRIEDSRIGGTNLLARALATAERGPRVLVSASAIGYYGDRGEEVLEESSAPGRGFLPDVCRAWENATDAARDAGIRVVTPRVGVVLSPAGGALAPMLLPFKLGLGGPIGAGRNWMSWISLDDLVRVLAFALEEERLEGPVNAVAPAPERFKDFARTLGRVLARPAFLALPAFAVKLALGEMAKELLLASARVRPARLEGSGFRFEHGSLESALRHVLKRPG